MSLLKMTDGDVGGDDDNFHFDDDVWDDVVDGRDHKLMKVKEKQMLSMVLVKTMLL